MSSNIIVTELEKALSSLDGGIVQPKNEFTRDATIQRFEYTFELTWRLAGRFLQKYGIQSSAPRTIIRDMAQQGWISDATLWFRFLDDRNLTAHTYKESIADQVYETAKAFSVNCHTLLQKFKTL